MADRRRNLASVARKAAHSGGSGREEAAVSQPAEAGLGAAAASQPAGAGLEGGGRR